jgi:pyridoxine kinase
MNKIPRVAAAHDMSGLGRCSLTVILPVLSVMGAQCCPLQTAYLSAHTAFPVSSEAAFCDLTGAMRRTVRHWAELGTEFDAIYSGFLGSAEQISVLQECIDTFRTKKTLVLVDPVMGDHGTIYRTYTPEMCSLMCLLAEKADLITPNLTEAAILLGEEYENIPHDEAAYRGWLTRLSLRGSRSVVITGATLEPGMVGAASFCRENGEFDFSMDREERGEFSGTGDLFAAVLLGALLRGEKLPAAAARAVAFIRRCAAHTLELGTPLLEGVQFEQLLGGLILQGV